MQEELTKIRFLAINHEILNTDEEKGEGVLWRYSSWSTGKWYGLDRKRAENFSQRLRQTIQLMAGLERLIFVQDLVYMTEELYTKDHHMAILQDSHGTLRLYDDIPEVLKNSPLEIKALPDLVASIHDVGNVAVCRNVYGCRHYPSDKNCTYGGSLGESHLLEDFNHDTTYTHRFRTRVSTSHYKSQLLPQFILLLLLFLSFSTLKESSTYLINITKTSKSRNRESTMCTTTFTFCPSCRGPYLVRTVPCESASGSDMDGITQCVNSYEEKAGNVRNCVRCTPS